MTGAGLISKGKEVLRVNFPRAASDESIEMENEGGPQVIDCEFQTGGLP